MNNKAYQQIAELIVSSDDVGGELVKLLMAIDARLLNKKEGILITQAVPEDGEGNPVVEIAVFTNKQTDFPLESEKLYKQWVIKYAERLIDAEK